MFDLSLAEILVIGLLTILMIKPEDLPKFFRLVGKIYGKFESAKTRILRECNWLGSLEDDIRIIPKEKKQTKRSKERRG